jgi:hypothetical protein
MDAEAEKEAAKEKRKLEERLVPSCCALSAPYTT